MHKVVQIVIGIVHFCFGAVSASISGSSYTPVAAISGYPFWGALFFIASGSLSVSVEKHLRVELVKCSVGMNITSAVMSVTGIMLYISELALNSLYYDYDYYHHYDLLWSTGMGLGVLLFLFSLLEFAITVSAAHFGCQATCCHYEPATVFVPYTVSGDAAVDNPPPPPSYDNHTFSPKYEP
ncbi:membrane-spanning 4-domains subfamily A member 8-like isoform X2 [Hemicordylus capensis]|uniref:membrane-spanning 4-domains subfamily A member 8-like isoform X2 n=1 Tax=Hemicordylus capensis TaxID=884348 RepID=UPI002304A119|nr:membrane-spanning 4-domains subfamily A member 8-like isoform X2 [Hemicordylus capensis]